MTVRRIIPAIAEVIRSYRSIVPRICVRCLDDIGARAKSFAAPLLLLLPLLLKLQKFVVFAAEGSSDQKLTRPANQKQRITYKIIFSFLSAAFLSAGGLLSFPGVRIRHSPEPSISSTCKDNSVCCHGGGGIKGGGGPAGHDLAGIGSANRAASPAVGAAHVLKGAGAYIIRGGQAQQVGHDDSHLSTADGGVGTEVPGVLVADHDGHGLQNLNGLDVFRVVNVGEARSAGTDDHHAQEHNGSQSQTEGPLQVSHSDFLLTIFFGLRGAGFWIKG